MKASAIKPTCLVKWLMLKLRPVYFSEWGRSICNTLYILVSVIVIVSVPASEPNHN